MKTVLIVDDESRLIQSIEAGLKIYRDRFNVVTALNGKQAINILNQSDIDLVVTDLKMPEVDGFELLAYICKTFPSMPAIVMTAFSTPDIEEYIESTNSLKLLEKPIDFDELADSILENLEKKSQEYKVAGFSLANFMQLLQMEQKTSLLNVKSNKGQGLIYFQKGELYAALIGNVQGEEAVYKMLSLKNIEISLKQPPPQKVKKNIRKNLMAVLLEGARLNDEDKEQPIEEPENFPDNSNQINQLKKGAIQMQQIEENLAKLKDVEGFLAVGVFTPNGEMAAQVNNSGLKIEEIGALANDVLLKAQKATDLMDVGRGQTVHVEAPKAHIIARCLNENTDFSVTEAGKAHIHVVMVISKDGNLAMAKMKLNSVIGEVATDFR